MNRNLPSSKTFACESDKKIHVTLPKTNTMKTNRKKNKIYGKKLINILFNMLKNEDQKEVKLFPHTYLLLLLLSLHTRCWRCVYVFEYLRFSLRKMKTFCCNIKIKYDKMPFTPARPNKASHHVGGGSYRLCRPNDASV